MAIACGCHENCECSKESDQEWQDWYAGDESESQKCHDDDENKSYECWCENRQEIPTDPVLGEAKKED
jgi:hypothetical protein